MMGLVVGLVMGLVMGLMVRLMVGLIIGRGGTKYGAGLVTWWLVQVGARGGWLRPKGAQGHTWSNKSHFFRAWVSVGLTPLSYASPAASSAPTAAASRVRPASDGSAGGAGLGLTPAMIEAACHVGVRSREVNVDVRWACGHVDVRWA